MIKKIRWKVKVSKNKDWHPGLKFIKVKVTLERTQEDWWNQWLDKRIELDEMTVNKTGDIIYKEYCDFNCVTLAALAYLEQLKDSTEEQVVARHTKTSQIMRTIETLQNFWD